MDINDTPDFLTAHGNEGARADWNFDGMVDGADAILFNYSYAQGCCHE